MVFAPITINADTASIPEPKSEFYINDYLGNVDQKVKNFVVNVNDVLYKKTGGQIVFTVTDFSNGLGPEEYAHQMFQKFAIGDKKKNNGILIVIFEEEESGLFQPQLGDGASNFISEAKLQTVLQDNFQPYFDDFDTDMAIASTLEALVKLYENEYNVDVMGEFSGEVEESQGQGNVVPTPQPQQKQSSAGIWIFLVIVLVVVIIMLSTSRRRYTTYYSGWMPSYGIRPRWSPFRMYSPYRTYHPFYSPPRPRNRHYGGQNNPYGSGSGYGGTGTQPRDNRPSSSSTPSNQRRTGGGGSSSAPSRGGERGSSSSSGSSSWPSSRGSGSSSGGSRSSGSSGFRGGGASKGFGGGSRGGGGGSSSGPSRGGGRRK